MRRIIVSIALLSFLSLFLDLGVSSAFATTALVVVSTNPNWVPVASSSGPTYVLPAVIPGCGSENTTSCEPTGNFIFNQTWSGSPSVIKILDPDNTTLSDLIAFDSNGPGGLMQVNFYSDPSLPVASQYSSYTVFATYTETSGGFVSSPVQVCCITNGSGQLSVVVASDDEGAFDPFHAGFDVSDGIQFQGAVPGAAVPEPGTLTLLGSGLISLAGLIRRKLIQV